MTENFYFTSDYPFACFLKMSGIDLREIRKERPDGFHCSFVFRIEPNSPELRALQTEWNHSERAKDLKRILYASRVLKRELRDFLTKHDGKEIIR